MLVYREGPREAEAALEPKLIDKYKRKQEGLLLVQRHKQQFYRKRSSIAEWAGGTWW